MILDWRSHDLRQRSQHLDHVGTGVPSSIVHGPPVNRPRYRYQLIHNCLTITRELHLFVNCWQVVFKTHKTVRHGHCKQITAKHRRSNFIERQVDSFDALLCIDADIGRLKHATTGPRLLSSQTMPNMSKPSSGFMCLRFVHTDTPLSKLTRDDRMLVEVLLYSWIAV